MKSKILLIFFLGVLISCHKDVDIITIEDKEDPPPVLITTKLVSQNDTTTDVTIKSFQFFAGQAEEYYLSPYIITEGNLADRDFELVRLETPDGLQFYHVDALVENDVNYLHWNIPLINYAAGHSASDADINLGGEYQLNLPANSIQHLDGSIYNGSYQIAYSLLDPSGPFSEAIPSYTGIRDHQHVALHFDQCIYLNVLSESGEKLKFSAADILHLTPTSLQDLWTFNEGQAKWIPYEPQSNQSEIKLGTSLYYGMAGSEPVVRMTGTYVLNGKLTPHQELRLSYGNTSRKIYTTNSGAWAVMIPSNTTCTLETSLPCGTTFSHSVHSQENSFHVPLAVDKQTCVNAVYTGTVRNNSAEAVHGIIVVNGEQSNFYYADDLEFNFNVPTCLGHSNGIKGLDVTTGQYGPLIHWEAADTTHLFSVFACEEANYEYLSLSVSGEGKMYWDLKTRIQNSRLIIEEGVSEPDLNLMLLISGMDAREYGNTELNIEFEDENLGSRGYSLYCPTSPNGCGFTKFIITHYPATQGQWIRGYFEGLFWIKTFHPLTGGYRPVKGEFQVFRDF